MEVVYRITGHKEITDPTDRYGADDRERQYYARGKPTAEFLYLHDVKQWDFDAFNTTNVDGELYRKENKQGRYEQCPDVVPKFKDFGDYTSMKNEEILPTFQDYVDRDGIDVFNLILFNESYIFSSNKERNQRYYDARVNGVDPHFKGRERRVARDKAEWKAHYAKRHGAFE
jgi:hypothetical protein